MDLVLEDIDHQPVLLSENKKDIHFKDENM